MAGRDSRASRRGMEKKLWVAVEVMLLKEREHWSRERQQLLEEKKNLQEKLSISEGKNLKLQADLLEAREEISALEEKYDATIVAWWRQHKQEQQDSEKEIIKREEQIALLHQSLASHKEENERMRAALHTLKERCQREAGQLKELLVEKDTQISRVSKQHFPVPATKSSTSIKTLKPTHHHNTNRKNTDWSLNVREKCLIIGDSNLSRISPHTVQVDSYPGAKFSHVEPLLEKVQVNTAVKKVVLSFGINDRNTEPRETIQRVQKAHRAAQHAFPNAQIYIPAVNFSDKLPIEQQNNLQAINQYLVDNMAHIPQLQRIHFQTVRDQIHWSSRTAQKMLQHWMSHLNQTSTSASNM